MGFVVVSDLRIAYFALGCLDISLSDLYVESAVVC